MDKSAATRIIESTFDNSFDKTRFTNFVRNLFNEIEDSSFVYGGGIIPDTFKQYINSLERIGKYSDDEDNKIDVLIVNLKKDTSLERARTMQRNFVAWYLNGSRGGELKDAAVAAFVSPNEDDWRFSLVKMDYVTEQTLAGKIKVKTEYTPARRWSFLVGKNESCHTAKKQLFPILQDDRNNPSLSQLETAFDIEIVTKEFFGNYRSLFLELKDELDVFVEKDEKTKATFEKNDVSTADFAKKLLGQIVFLYFLQKKGWFGVDRDEKWGSGPKNFLRRLFDKKHCDYNNFFNDILEPLFYRALAIKRPYDYDDRFKCKIPFLNGGLFDPINNYDWVNTDINIPDETFSNKNKTGIFDVFDLYNFTVKEDEPLEKEVAVDPEMLGKVFENLLEVKDRKSKGTYYTPREIVHYMCQQSLINYLKTEFSEKVPPKDLEKFINTADTSLEYDIIAVEKAEKIRRGEQKKSKYNETILPKSICENAMQIDDALKNIRVCDPAIGSGAFPVGMMTEIVNARKALSPHMTSSSTRTHYEFKRHCIQNSLHGVDIEPGAVEIAKLRLWLSLIVDEDDIKQIQPLPNLDYKIMQGNSLLEEYEGIKLIDESFFKKEDGNEEIIRKLKDEQNELSTQYIQLHQNNKLTPQEKEQLNKRLTELKKRIENLKKSENSVLDTDDMFSVNKAKEKAEQLLILQKQFFETVRKDDKDLLKEQIESLTWELIETTLIEEGKENKLEEIEKYKKSNTKPFFLWHLNFANVFQEKGGFDVVIGNPPYIQLQKAFDDTRKYADLYKNLNFKSFERTGDIYALFYEKGLEILRQDGYLCYITSNKWMRANYGKSLRKFFAKLNPKILIDLGPDVFTTATVDTNILLIQKSCPENINLNALSLKEKIKIDSFDDKNFVVLDDLSEKSWIICSKEEMAIKKKIEKIGTPLKDWDISIYRGVLTGFNEAFIIDGKKKNELIAADPKNAEIIKPILRGRDIKKYSANFADLWLIFIPWHFPLHKDSTISGASEKAENEFEKQYPSIYQHLLKYKERLSKRNQAETGIRYEWYALQRCAATYYEDFEKEKIAWAETAQEIKMTFVGKNVFLQKTCFFITGENLKYICSIYNSKLMDFYARNTLAGLGKKGLCLTKDLMQTFPVPKISESEQKPFVELVDKILEKKKDNPEADTSELERKIDELVYELYELTDEEIKIIES